VDAEIIAIGTELLTPHRQDTNSLFLTERLNRLGVEVHFKTVVGDRRADLVAAARIALSRANLIIFMGGLGPTEDDLTREAVAEALGIELHRDPQLIAELYKRFAALRLKMSPNNERQAEVLAGAEVLPNANGSAPGQFLNVNFAGEGRFIFLLPGPPRELEPMFDEQGMARLRKLVPEQHIATRVLKIAMLGESQCDARVAPIYARHKDVETTVLAGAGEVQLHLRSRAASAEEAERRVQTLQEELEDELEEFVFARGGESLEQIVGYFLQLHGQTLAVAESCTGGLIAQRITKIGGSSRYFIGGVVVYSNEMKTQFAGVPAETIAKYGAVSSQVARALAEGIRTRCNASFGIGVTGVAGPGGGSDEKPVGLVFHALADKKKTEVVERRFPGDRERVRWFASQQALDMLRRKLME
jgi:nicotinamide-nucleotide amidase